MGLNYSERRDCGCFNFLAIMPGLTRNHAAIKSKTSAEVLPSALTCRFQIILIDSKPPIVIPADFNGATSDVALHGCLIGRRSCSLRALRPLFLPLRLCRY